jgi:hypothetical protein
MTTDELKDWFEQTAKIITDLNICLNNANRLFDFKYENEDWVKNHGFFRHHYYQLWFIISIQLTKLLSPSRNQKYNFNKLLNRLEQEELDENILQLFEQNKVKPFTAVFRDKNEMLNKILFYKQEIKSNEATVNKFITSRDTLYAHRDPNATLQGLTLPDAERLIALCKDIYNCFRGGIFDVYFDFTRTHDWSIDFVLKQAASAKTQRNKKT